jgi:hypothetical protein
LDEKAADIRGGCTVNIVIIMQLVATVPILLWTGFLGSFAFRRFKLQRLFNKDYIRFMGTKKRSRCYPFVPRRESKKYESTRSFLRATGWLLSVEDIYLWKWFLFSIALFILITIRTTNIHIQAEDILQDMNYRRNIIETLREDTSENIYLEKQVFELANDRLKDDKELYNVLNKQTYVEYIEHLLEQKGMERGGESSGMASRLYYKILQIRMLQRSVAPYVYIFLVACLAYHLPDLLGQIKRKLIEDKKNWEILNCMIIFSIFGRMPPFSIQSILEHMIIATEVYKPLLEQLLEGIKKGGLQEGAFDSALESVDRDELYEIIETMKRAKQTGLVNSVEGMEDAIENTIKWIEIENISRRRTKMLYAMSSVAVVMALGCIYFAYALTVISNPANMMMK